MVFDFNISSILLNEALACAQAFAQACAQVGIQIFLKVKGAIQTLQYYVFRLCIAVLSFFKTILVWAWKLVKLIFQILLLCVYLNSISPGLFLRICSVFYLSLQFTALSSIILIPLLSFLKPQILPYVWSISTWTAASCTLFLMPISTILEHSTLLLLISTFSPVSLLVRFAFVLKSVDLASTIISPILSVISPPIEYLFFRVCLMASAPIKDRSAYYYVCVKQLEGAHNNSNPGLILRLLKSMSPEHIDNALEISGGLPNSTIIRDYRLNFLKQRLFESARTTLIALHETGMLRLIDPALTLDALAILKPKWCSQNEFKALRLEIYHKALSTFDRVDKKEIKIKQNFQEAVVTPVLAPQAAGPVVFRRTVRVKELEVLQKAANEAILEALPEEKRNRI
jgi:hypothetical protein